MFGGKAITELEESAVSEYLNFFWVADAGAVTLSETIRAKTRPAVNRKDVPRVMVIAFLYVKLKNRFAAILSGADQAA